MSLTARVSLVALLVLMSWSAAEVSAQGFYYRTVQKNRLTGRQEIVDLQRPRWTGAGQGGFAFEPAIGSMQVTAVGRNRATGRLEYYNQYMNPWTGAQYSTATQFNPYSGRYETLHQIEPPTRQEKRDAVPVEPVVVTTPVEKPKRRVRVIEPKLDVDAPPRMIAPGATLPELTPGGVLPPLEAASSKTIEWKKEHPEATLDLNVEPKEEM